MYIIVYLYIAILRLACRWPEGRMVKIPSLSHEIHAEMCQNLCSLTQLDSNTEHASKKSSKSFKIV